jgi:hypothetical protein
MYIDVDKARNVGIHMCEHTYLYICIYIYMCIYTYICIHYIRQIEHINVDKSGNIDREEFMGSVGALLLLPYYPINVPLLYPYYIITPLLLPYLSLLHPN